MMVYIYKGISYSFWYHFQFSGFNFGRGLHLQVVLPWENVPNFRWTPRDSLQGNSGQESDQRQDKLHGSIAPEPYSQASNL